MRALVFFTALSCFAADWPAWRGPNRDAVSGEQGLLKQWPAGGPPLAWRASGLGRGFSSIAIAGNRIYTLGDRSDGQYALALNLADGKQVWATKVGPVWEDEYGGPRGTPAVDGDRLYVVGTEGDLLCLDAASGRERWRRSLPGDFGGRMMSVWKFSESPLIDGGRVIVTPGSPQAMIAALDKLTGKEVWRAAVPSAGPQGKDGAAYSSVVISNGAGVKQYIQLTGRGLVSVRADDGKPLWTYNRIANDVANIPTPIVRGDYVFTSTGYGTGSALLKLEKTANGVQVQEQYWLGANQFQNHHGGMVLVGDYLYAGQGHNNGLPICIEFLTGKIRWGGNQRNEGRGSAAVLYADGHLYFRYQNGKMMLIEATPEGYREKGIFDIPNVRNPSWSHPVIHDGKLYLREQDTLFVYNIRS
ncbi:MAG: PQQ-like beta-propeller repeat protein [Bryobacteraceae bacterium]|nr:PQQ-like beta-propeller repeat protein [Bryobacteraceae bacterium]